MLKKDDWDYLGQNLGLLAGQRNYGLLENLEKPLARGSADPDDDETIYYESLTFYDDFDIIIAKRRHGHGNQRSNKEDYLEG